MTAEKKSDLKYELGKKIMSIKVNNVKISIKNMSIQPFDENVKPKSIDDVMYLYYLLKMKVGKKTYKFQAYDFPKLQNVGKYIDYIIDFDVKSMGLKINDIDKDGYRKSEYYKQMLLEDSFGEEYFIKFEKYCTLGHQSSGEEFNIEWYNMIFVNPNGECVFMERLEESDLIKFKEYADGMINYEIENYEIEGGGQK